MLHFLFDFSLVVGGSVKKESSAARKDEAVLVLAMYVLSLASVVALVLA